MGFGYAIAPDAEAVAALAAVQPRWSVNWLALAVIEALIPRIDLAAWADAVTRGREELPAAFGSRGLDVIDTDACWCSSNIPISVGCSSLTVSSSATAPRSGSTA